MLTALFLANAAIAATPLVGVEWRPLSRADLNWLEDGRSSGLSVGEFDGTVDPGLSMFAGAWWHPRIATTGRLGVARLQNTTQVGDVVTQRHWGVIRPGVDLRWGLMKPRDRTPYPWLLGGVHVDIPSARDVSNGYSKAEQKAADENATTERARLGGFGLRAGLGADYRPVPYVALGLQYALTWRRGVFLSDDRQAVSSWLAAEAALLIAFEWPRAPSS
jgi:hypothetical protein